MIRLAISVKRVAYSFQEKLRGFSLSAMRYPLYAMLLLLTTACNDDMRNQARYEPLEASNLFENGQASRPIVKGTIPRGHLELDETLTTGKAEGKHLTSIPLTIDAKLLERGQERYNIYCSVCHDAVGTGNGMVVQRGFTQPPSLHEQRLRDAPVGYLFEVMTQGLGDMAGYASEVNVHDRWAIVAYIQALQLSQNASLTDASKEEQTKLLGSSHE